LEKVLGEMLVTHQPGKVLVEGILNPLEQLLKCPTVSRLGE
jgi:hypothetical protein